ncbi:MAG TPA: helix-turn-helix domain-containing protein, partial [Candidatus Binatia bacterium]|nr:helix-turn-helix domain-containing protein [Candidatus Binatia bacterium]
VPPLRERPEDITLLVHYFVHKYAVKTGKRILEVSQEAMKRVSAYPWPGNIRELEYCIERAVILSRGPTLDISDEFFPPEASLKDKEEYPRALAEVEREYIVKTLEKTGGVIEGPRGAATILKLHPNTLRGRMRKLGITRDHDLR